MSDDPRFDESFCVHDDELLDHDLLELEDEPRDYGIDRACVICGEFATDECSECCAPLCSMHWEMLGGFCPECPTADFDSAIVMDDAPPEWGY
jgi:hypothetical protein